MLVSMLQYATGYGITLYYSVGIFCPVCATVIPTLHVSVSRDQTRTRVLPAVKTGAEVGMLAATGGMELSAAGAAAAAAAAVRALLGSWQP